MAYCFPVFYMLHPLLLLLVLPLSPLLLLLHWSCSLGLT